ncbi:MAG: hypothetical protein KC933_08990 [Myxococcales bacterium]|nr:hypothetical protein [Myxococcales bacterium]MCB9650407.1 hypothetical protein [Deltaproteobacteria bacterium]
MSTTDNPLRKSIAAAGADPIHRLRNLVGSSLLTVEAILRLQRDLPPDLQGDLARVVEQLREAGTVIRKLPDGRTPAPEHAKSAQEQAA